MDCVTEILDARIPLSSRNPEIGEITAGKPRIILLNKCDMADEKVTADWIKYFRSTGAEALAVDCRSGKGLNAYTPLVRKVLAEKIKANTDRGMAGISLKNYFLLYKKIAGMSGTIMPVEDELKEIYNLKCASLPTHKPLIRQDNPLRIFKNTEDKDNAIIKAIIDNHKSGRPTLVGSEADYP